MGDSEDEYDRKRRDKFRGERAEASYRGADRVVRPRDDWVERDAWSRPRPRDYRGPVRDRGYSPSLEPASKRLRHDFYGESYFNHYTPYHPTTHRESQTPAPVEGQQPPMMSFKAFLATQDDNISDSEAIEKYNDYKLEFQRQQLNEFFVAHKDDEWFRLKYHPEDSVKRKDDQMNALKRRVAVFLELLNGKRLESVSVDCSKTSDLVKLLDTVVIKLEGGTEEDIAILEQEYADVEERKFEVPKPEEKKIAEPEKNTNDTPAGADVTEIKEESEATKDKEGEIDEVTTNGEAAKEQQDTAKEPENADDNEPMNTDQAVEDEAKPEEGEEEEDGEEKMDTESTVDDKVKHDEEDENVKNADDAPQDETSAETKKSEKTRKRSYSGSSSSSSSSSSDSDVEKESKPKEEKKDEPVEIPEDAPEEDKPEIILEEVKVEKPRALHKTTSIFLRNLAPTITRQEVEAMCARYDGFLRVALADPQPERRWLRRGWVTFKRDANIKEICWNLNNIRLRDCELGAIVNRDLSRRIRPVNGIAGHKQVVRSDIRISAKVVLHLDSKAGLWPDDEQKKEKPQQQTFGLVSNNPVLHNITDYLIEEASAEEEELLGLEPTTDTQDSATTVERDDSLVRVLDKIILYLRVVHSVDYYNHCEYPNEDEMPNRCGILHARGPPPTTKTDITQFVGAPIEGKMSNFLPEKQTKDENKNETKLISLSLKDVDAEIDKFVQANTRELAKDKWLCPLSGKKFKGPDFVRKHIFNKHAEKIDEVKKEVEFFNNYLRDPKRPMLAEAPQPKREEPPAYNHMPYGNSYGGGGGGPPRYYNQGYNSRPRGYAPRSRGGGGGGGGGDFRPVIHYRDLDAPREPEEFI